MTRTFIPTTSFVSSPDTEKERILYAAGNVAGGFYPRHGFLILPKPYPKYKNYCVILPKELKNVSQKFWKDAAWGGIKMPSIITERMWRETESIKPEAINQTIIKKFQNSWQNIENEVWKAVSAYFPSEVKWIKSLEVRLTNYGSLGSHYLLSKKSGQNLIINIRVDGSHLDIINLVVLALIYPLANELHLSFTNRMALRNFILKRDEFKRLDPNFTPRTYHQPKVPKLLRQKSENYIKFLGIPDIVDPLKIINQNYDVFGTKEGKLIDLLISNKNELVTYDQIADEIWGKGEFKSYWAINKLVQRIQIKLKRLKINNSIMLGIRGKGYKLVT